MVAEVDRMQVEPGEGPRIDAILDHHLVSGADRAADPRGPTWGPAVVAATGIRSMMCFRLFTSEDVVGAWELVLLGHVASEDHRLL